MAKKSAPSPDTPVADTSTPAAIAAAGLPETVASPSDTAAMASPPDASPVADEASDDLVQLTVTALSPRRCRAGLVFGPEPSTVTVTPAQAAQIQADPLLRSEPAED